MLSRPAKASDRRRRRGFHADQRGIAAVEFALLAPLLILMYFGVAELTEGLMANRKVSVVASTIGDLVSQSSTTTPSQLTDVFNIGAVVMQPYATTGNALTMRITSVTVDSTGTPKVDWSQASAGLTALSKGATVTLPYAPKTQPTDPNTPFISIGQSVIMAEARYNFTSPVAQFMPAVSQLKDTLYLFPRGGSKVSCSTC